MKHVISVVGGLGNQMFQYAYSLTFKKNDAVRLNDSLARHGESNYGSELGRVFGIRMQNRFCDSFLIWLTRKCIVLGSQSRFSGLFLLPLKLLSLFGIVIKSDYLTQLMKQNDLRCRKSIWYGRFQSERYFVEHREQVMNAFRFDPAKVSAKTRETADEIVRENSISVHIRRGDYLKPVHQASFGNICTPEYYRTAIRTICKRVEKPVFYIFSDDIPWAKANLGSTAHYIDWNTNENAWEDLYLMSLCKHNIIANSTFSWWGAWLNRNPDKLVLCPPKYTHFDDSNDFYPEKWIRISGVQAE